MFRPGEQNPIVELWVVNFSSENPSAIKVELGEGKFRDYMKQQGLGWSEIYGEKDFLIKEVIYNSEDSILVTGKNASIYFSIDSYFEFSTQNILKSYLAIWEWIFNFGLFAEIRQLWFYH